MAFGQKALEWHKANRRQELQRLLAYASFGFGAIFNLYLIKNF
jgi:hypothetical protein